MKHDSQKNLRKSQKISEQKIDSKIFRDFLRFSEIFFGLDINRSDYSDLTNLIDEELVAKVKEMSLKNSSFSNADSFLKPIFNNILDSDYSVLQNQTFFVGVDDIVLSKFSKDLVIVKIIKIRH